MGRPLYDRLLSVPLLVAVRPARPVPTQGPTIGGNEPCGQNGDYDGGGFNGGVDPGSIEFRRVGKRTVIPSWYGELCGGRTVPFPRPSNGTLRTVDPGIGSTDLCRRHREATTYAATIAEWRPLPSAARPMYRRPDVRQRRAQKGDGAVSLMAQNCPLLGSYRRGRTWKPIPTKSNTENRWLRQNGEIPAR